MNLQNLTKTISHGSVLIIQILFSEFIELFKTTFLKLNVDLSEHLTDISTSQLLWNQKG